MIILWSLQATENYPKSSIACVEFNKMFFVNYDLKTGEIISYTGAQDDTDNDVSAEHGTLKFTSDIPGFINSNGACMMKVDVENKVLVFKNPVTIPKPIG